MHHAIVCCQIRNCHQGGAIDHHAFCRDVNGDVLVIQHGHHHAIGDVCAHHIALGSMIAQDT